MPVFARILAAHVRPFWTVPPSAPFTLIRQNETRKKVIRRTGGVDRRRIGLQESVSRSAFFAFLTIELDGVVVEDADWVSGRVNSEQKATYACFDEGPWPRPNMQQLRRCHAVK